MYYCEEEEYRGPIPVNVNSGGSRNDPRFSERSQHTHQIDMATPTTYAHAVPLPEATLHKAANLCEKLSAAADVQKLDIAAMHEKMTADLRSLKSSVPELKPKHIMNFFYFFKFSVFHFFKNVDNICVRYRIPYVCVCTLVYCSPVHTKVM